MVGNSSTDAFHSFPGDLATALSALYNYFTPPPTCSLFQEGGLLYGYNEDIVLTAGTMGILWLMDTLIVKPYIKAKARYFALHFISNMMVVAASAPGMLRVLTKDPFTVFDGAGPSMSNNIIAALHVYHCVAFNLSADDIFHHLTFCLTLCSLAIPTKHLTGDSISFGTFFMSGLPGGIDYLLLTLSAHGLVSKDLQKYVYTKINIWVRSPGLVILAYLWWINRYSYPHPLPLVYCCICVPLNYYNGQFYLQQAIESHAIYKYKKELAAKGVKVPEIRFSELHEKEQTNRKQKNGANDDKAASKLLDAAEDASTSSMAAIRAEGCSSQHLYVGEQRCPAPLTAPPNAPASSPKLRPLTRDPTSPMGLLSSPTTRRADATAVTFAVTTPNVKGGTMLFTVYTPTTRAATAAAFDAAAGATKTVSSGECVSGDAASSATEDSSARATSSSSSSSTDPLLSECGAGGGPNAAPILSGSAVPHSLMNSTSSAAAIGTASA